MVGLFNALNKIPYQVHSENQNLKIRCETWG
jgi:hypothetical protein